MCGINGIISKAPFELINSSLESMNNLIVHRGPDDDGIYVNSERTVALGMRRLSIIDLVSGHQPMISEDGKIVIVFNGEIYNYQELRKVLIAQYNVQFKTSFYTEVILLGYQHEGQSFFVKLNGMYAIAIYDLHVSKLFVVRDRVGEKPLYYWKNEEYFIFGSELKSIKHILNDRGFEDLKISKIGLNIYFNLTFIPAPHTIYENVFKLESGRYIEYDLSSFEYKEIKYWDIQEVSEKDKLKDYTRAKKILRESVYDSVEKRMMSDVPYGAFLSGGVDSSIITAVMADIKSDERIKTFSIISDNKKFDESARSNAVSKHCQTEHFPILLDFDAIQEDMEKVILNFDEPFADSSALPSFFVSKITKQYVKVALTGDGGDEVFGGYNRYLMQGYANKYRKIVPEIIHNNLVKPLFDQISLKKDDRGALFKIKKFLRTVNATDFDNLINIMSLGFLNEELTDMLNSSYYVDSKQYFFSEIYHKAKNFSTISKARFLDFKIALEGDMLVKVDRSSMLNSMECRSPFLDHRLVEFGFMLPDNFLIQKGQTKMILKDTFKDHLPEGLFSLPKSGFGVPVGDWLRDSLRDELISYIDPAFIQDQGIFNLDYITKLVNNHLEQKDDNTFKVWTFYCFQKWYNSNF